jgi:cytochrome c
MTRHRNWRAWPRAVTLLLLLAGPARATDLTDAQARTLFNLRSCNACHGVDEQRIGPAFTAVSARYHDGAASKTDWLAEKIRWGGAGSWGQVPMISNRAVSPDEAHAMARWILGLKPRHGAR